MGAEAQTMGLISFRLRAFVSGVLSGLGVAECDGVNSPSRRDFSLHAEGTILRC